MDFNYTITDGEEVERVDPLKEDRSGRGEVDPFKSKARGKV